MLQKRAADRLVERACGNSPNPNPLQARRNPPHVILRP
jgi:hypothetical protein